MCFLFFQLEQASLQNSLDLDFEIPKILVGASECQEGGVS
jgi:hypothetical protein